MSAEFYKIAKKGKILGFKKDGEFKRYKIVKFSKVNKVCIVEEVKLYTPEEAEEKIQSELTLEDVLEHFKGQKLETTEDVIKALDHIGAPGKRQELKRQAVEKLFKGKSPQGYSVADSLEGYEEF